MCSFIAGFVKNYDGEFGAVVGEGKYIVLTRNAKYIPEPPIGIRNVIMRTDYRFGADDHMQWPQPYVARNCHFACIPYRSISDTVNDVLWRPPMDQDFLADKGFLPTIGRYRPSLASDLEAAIAPTLERTKKFLSSSSEHGSARELAGSIAMNIKHLLCRIHLLSASRHYVFLTVTSCQRLGLELIGLLDYMEVFCPRINGIAPAAKEPAKVIGAYTTELAVWENFTQAGIPVWMIHDHRALPTLFIKHCVDATSPTSTLTLSPFPNMGPVFVGSAISDDKLRAIRKFMQGSTEIRDPFDVERTLTDNTPTTSTSKSGKTNKQRPSPCKPFFIFFSNLLIRRDRPPTFYRRQE
jgi:hypothetical protein